MSPTPSTTGAIPIIGESAEATTTEPSQAEKSSAEHGAAPRPGLSNRAALWTAAAVAAIALWASGAPSTSYPLYEHDWNVTPATTTTIFAVYPLVLVVVLLVFGGLSDFIGRRATILIGLAALLVGTALFALAPDVTWLFIGRAFMGAGVGFALSPASAAVVEFSAPERAARASSITTAGTALGLVCATLIGGFFIQYLPDPLHLDFAVLGLAILVVGAFAWRMPRHTRAENADRWRPRAVHIPRGLRKVFVTAALSVTVAYMFGSVFLALGATLAENLTRTPNVFVIGGVLAIMSACIGLAAVFSRSVPPRALTAAGSILAIVAVGMLQLSASTHSLAVFMITTLIAGAAYAFLFSGGLGLVSAHAAPHHRAGTLSAVYLVAYVLQGAIAVVLGLIATASGLDQALFWATLVLTVFGLVALGFAIATRPRRARQTEGAR